MNRRDFLKGAGASTVVLATPHIVLAQPQQAWVYELNNQSINPLERGLESFFESVYIFSSELELVLSNGETTSEPVNPVGTVLRGKEGLVLLTADHTVSNYDQYAHTPDKQRKLRVTKVRETYKLTTDDGKVVDLTKLASDPEYDIALLKLPEGANVKALSINLGDSNHLVIGSFLYTVGTPASAGKRIIEGTVSSPVSPKDINFTFYSIIQPGNSGGPIVGIRKGLDGKGKLELVGVLVDYDAQSFGKGVTVNRIREKFVGYLR